MVIHLMLEVEIEDNNLKAWRLIPCVIGLDYQTKKADNNTAKRMMYSFDLVSKKLAAHNENYADFFKWQYKKEIILHTASTIYFLLKTRGFVGLFKMVMKRYEEVGRMIKWFTIDRSNDQRDDDAIKSDRKMFKQEELFG